MFNKTQVNDILEDQCEIHIYMIHFELSKKQRKKENMKKVLMGIVSY